METKTKTYFLREVSLLFFVDKTWTLTQEGTQEVFSGRKPLSVTFYINKYPVY